VSESISRKFKILPFLAHKSLPQYLELAIQRLPYRVAIALGVSEACGVSEFADSPNGFNCIVGSGLSVAAKYNPPHVIRHLKGGRLRSFSRIAHSTIPCNVFAPTEALVQPLPILKPPPTCCGGLDAAQSKRLDLLLCT
jgi:hypothetical protein